ncbi:flagellar filament capping protein FliD [Sansalvadorimonas sp. 2012CJ34-2]|uniref:Flagellar hook-associated protein 2 n=1 Tax=Parendozoicomonas callyspongiae TaxID=2942213 RepID=A0ABT0PHX2_9GAMM|nr:flagellar filament capping protein FliD [Sansalvadorimonas sp. 2012CJ34-2]MCL6270088.1 flagellar filament capping protein FliD [Sansalvadorimonas sp. 2012CJ34-2]
MSISMPGTGTGLDIQGMAKQMAKANLAGKSDQLTKQENKVNAEVAALNQLDSALDKFYSSLKTLSDPESFGTLKHNMSDDDQKFFTIKYDETAVANSYQIAVQQLAEKDKWNIMQTTSSKTPVLEGTGDTSREVEIKTAGMDSGTSFKITIDADDTLTDVMNKINDASDNPGIDASIVTGSNGAQLTLTSRETGTEKAITSIKIGSQALADNATNHINPAKDAQFTIDGIAVESQSNTVENAITGVTLNLLKKTDAANPIDVNLSTDTDQMKKSIKSLVDSYNTLRKVIDSVSKSEPAEPGETASRPPLASDTLVNSLNSQLRAALTSEVPGSSFKTLASVGIITKQNGDLEVDDKILDKALKDNPSEVVDLFVGTDASLNTLMKTVEVFIGTQSSSSDDSSSSTYTPKKDGLIKERLDRLKEEQTDIKNEWTEVNKRAEEVYQRYFNELNAMDLAVKQMNTSMQNLQKMM